MSGPGPLTPRLPDIDRRRRSPNFGPRTSGFLRPELLVLHYTGMRDGPTAITRLCDPASQVSCHYVVTEEGGILQLVDEAERAWCCGRSSWQGITDCNSASISIEIVNGGHDYGLPPYSDTQIASVARLCRDIVDRHGIRPERLLAHSDIAPGRKRDPGEHFPWERLAREGLGAWPESACLRAAGPRLAPGDEGGEVAALQSELRKYGYGITVTGSYDHQTETMIEAFQRHYRPGLVDGVADADTRSRLAALLLTFTG